MFNIIGLILTFLNDNLGIVTLLGGLFVIGLYFRQKNDYKREVAKLILEEIRYAEKQIKIARERGNVFLLSTTLLPTNNWYKNVHLFVNDLEQTDRDSISDFYSKVTYSDKVINRISDFKTNKGIPMIVPQPTNQQLSVPAESSFPGQSQSNSPANPQQQRHIMQFQLSAEIILQEVADQVEFLYNTPAADKLREIARKRWYQIF